MSVCISNPSVARVCRILGYDTSDRFLGVEDFYKVNGSRHLLRAAAEKMGVIGAVGRWESVLGKEKRPDNFVPILYLVNSKDRDDARNQHRRIWTQGAVPLILFITPSEVLPSIGFNFSYVKWDVADQSVDLSISDNKLLQELSSFNISRICSSLGLRSLAINPDGRVDKRLLKTLEALRNYLCSSGLENPKIVNSLIGRFLYFYVLHDRELISPAWLAKLGDPHAFSTRSDALTTKYCWKVFDEIDSLLNGTVFPFSAKERLMISDSNVRILRDCLKLGDILTTDSQQLSFIDFDLSSLQTETLSAIYEQFIDTEKQAVNGSKRTEGAYYTPPYLVDYVMDRVEEIVPLNSNCRILDGTAGSGVFLVSAFRRLVEQEISQSSPHNILSAKYLSALLTKSIFAVEKNPSAAAVCAFGLYLTMLDYLQSADLVQYLNGRRKNKLFPPLLDSNIIRADLFELIGNGFPKGWPKHFQIIVGNPPWQKLAEVTQQEQVIVDEIGTKIDSSEAAEAAFLLLTQRLLDPCGVVGMVLPTKSLIGPSANRFPNTLLREYSIYGITNLSHLRYKLFGDARQAASLLIAKCGLPDRTAELWTYSPTRVSLLSDSSAEPWYISVDRSRVERVKQLKMLESSSALFQQLMLRPIDRHISRYLADQVENGNFIVLGDFLDNHGLTFSRGGSPSQTGLPAEKILGADKHKENDYRLAPGVELLSKGRQAQLVSVRSKYRLSTNELNSLQNSFYKLFKGNVLLIPRSLNGIAFATKPLAFNSSINAIAVNESSNRGSRKQISTEIAKVLRVLGKYLCSDTAHYFYAITGRLWILDHARIEKNDLLQIPLPIESLDDPLIEVLGKCDDHEIDQILARKFGFDGWIKNAIDEYGKFRNEFEDGQVPNGYADPADQSLSSYIATLTGVLDPIFPKLKVVGVNSKSDCIPPLHIRILIDLFPRHSTNNNTAVDVDLANISHDEEEILFHPGSWNGFITKPNERFRWTVESAYADAATVLLSLTQ
jgi:hypothetical protein